MKELSYNDFCSALNSTCKVSFEGKTQEEIRNMMPLFIKGFLYRRLCNSFEEINEAVLKEFLDGRIRTSFSLIQFKIEDVTNDDLKPFAMWLDIIGYGESTVARMSEVSSKFYNSLYRVYTDNIDISDVSFGAYELYRYYCDLTKYLGDMVNTCDTLSKFGVDYVKNNMPVVRSYFDRLVKLKNSLMSIDTTNPDININESFVEIKDSEECKKYKDYRCIMRLYKDFTETLLPILKLKEDYVGFEQVQEDYEAQCSTMDFVGDEYAKVKVSFMDIAPIIYNVDSYGMISLDEDPFKIPDIMHPEVDEATNMSNQVSTLERELSIMQQANLNASNALITRKNQEAELELKVKQLVEQNKDKIEQSKLNLEKNIERLELLKEAKAKAEEEAARIKAEEEAAAKAKAERDAEIAAIKAEQEKEYAAIKAAEEARRAEEAELDLEGVHLPPEIADDLEPLVVDLKIKPTESIEESNATSVLETEAQTEEVTPVALEEVAEPVVEPVLEEKIDVTPIVVAPIIENTPAPVVETEEIALPTIEEEPVLENNSIELEEELDTPILEETPIEEEKIDVSSDLIDLEAMLDEEYMKLQEEQYQPEIKSYESTETFANTSNEGMPEVADISVFDEMPSLDDIKTDDSSYSQFDKIVVSEEEIQASKEQELKEAQLLRAKLEAAYGLNQLEPEPVIQPIAQPVVQQVAEPVVAPVVQQPVQPVVQPMAQPVVEPMLQTYAQPVVQAEIPTPVQVQPQEPVVVQQVRDGEKESEVLSKILEDAKKEEELYNRLSASDNSFNTTNQYDEPSKVMSMFTIDNYNKQEDIIFDYGTAYGNMLINNSDTKYNTINFLFGINKDDIELVREFKNDLDLSNDLCIKYLQANSQIVVRNYFNDRTIKRIQFADGCVIGEEVFASMIKTGQPKVSNTIEESDLTTEIIAEEPKVYEEIASTFAPGKGITLINKNAEGKDVNVIIFKNIKSKDVQVKRVISSRGTETKNIEITFISNYQDRIMIADFFLENGQKDFKFKFEDGMVWDNQFILTKLGNIKKVETTSSDFSTSTFASSFIGNTPKTNNTPKIGEYQIREGVGELKIGEDELYKSILFPEGITAANVKMRALSLIGRGKPKDLEITFNCSGDKILIESFLDDSIRLISTFVFSNGDKWTVSDIKKILDK